MEAMEETFSLSAIFDIKAETLAASLLAQAEQGTATEHIDLDRVMIALQGHAKRRSGPEVGTIRKKEVDESEVLWMEVHKKGLYDTLPERLFLNLDEEYDAPLEKTRAIERQIKEARKFFFPFEQALFQPLIEAERIEQNWTEHFPAFMKAIWDLPHVEDCLSERQWSLLNHLLPETARFIGNWDLTGLCFGAVLQKPVTLEFSSPATVPIPAQDIAGGLFTLDEDSVLGDSFTDDMPTLRVNVEEVSAEELPAFLPGGNNLRLLEECLYAYFLPLDLVVSTRIWVGEQAWGLPMGEPFIGYNFQL